MSSAAVVETSTQPLANLFDGAAPVTLWSLLCPENPKLTQSPVPYHKDLFVKVVLYIQDNGKYFELGTQDPAYYSGFDITQLVNGGGITAGGAEDGGDKAPIKNNTVIEIYGTARLFRNKDYKKLQYRYVLSLDDEATTLHNVLPEQNTTTIPNVGTKSLSKTFQQRAEGLVYAHFLAAQQYFNEYSTAILPTPPIADGAKFCTHCHVFPEPFAPGSYCFLENCTQTPATTTLCAKHPWYCRGCGAFTYNTSTWSSGRCQSCSIRGSCVNAYCLSCRANNPQDNGLCAGCNLDRFVSCSRCNARLSIFPKVSGVSHHYITTLLPSDVGFITVAGFVTQVSRLQNDSAGLITLFAFSPQDTTDVNAPLTPAMFTPMYITSPRKCTLRAGDLCQFLLLRSEKNQTTPTYILHQEIMSHNSFSSTTGRADATFSPTLLNNPDFPEIIKKELGALLFTTTTPHTQPFAPIVPHLYPHLELTISDTSLEVKRAMWLEEMNTKHFLGPKQSIQHYLAMLQQHQDKSPTTTPLLAQDVIDDINHRLEQYPAHLAALALDAPHLFLSYNRDNFSQDELEMMGLDMKEYNELIYDYTRYTMGLISFLTTVILSLPPHHNDEDDKCLKREDITSQQVINDNSDNNDNIKNDNAKLEHNLDYPKLLMAPHATFLQHATQDHHTTSQRHFNSTVSSALLHRRRLHGPASSQSMPLRMMLNSTTQHVLNPTTSPSSPFTNTMHNLLLSTSFLPQDQDSDVSAPEENAAIAGLALRLQLQECQLQAHVVQLVENCKRLEIKDQQIDNLTQQLQDLKLKKKATNEQI